MPIISGAVVTTPARGRGAWPTGGSGGTLSADGKSPGKFYRSTGTLPPIGRVAWAADRTGSWVGVDEYATWRATAAVQAHLNTLGAHLAVTGVWTATLDAAVKAWQGKAGLTADGVYGPASAKAMWTPVLADACVLVDASHPELFRLARGHVAYESGWDPGAVGVVSPVDLGLGQINGPAHPAMSAAARLDPMKALPWVAAFVDDNLRAFNYDVDAAVAAYNLGQGGTRGWIKAGRPDVFNGVYVRRYITKVLTP